MGDHVLGSRFLGVVVIEDYRAIYFADVIALAIECGWVVHHEEYLQDVAVTDGIWVKLQLDNFSMASAAGIYVVDRGVFERATAIAGRHVIDAVHTLIKRL